MLQTAASLVLRDREGGQVSLSVDGSISLLYQNSSQAPMPLPQALQHLYISLRLLELAALYGIGCLHVISQLLGKNWMYSFE